MNKIYFKDLENYFDKEIEISGFVENIRNIKSRFNCAFNSF